MDRHVASAARKVAHQMHLPSGRRCSLLMPPVSVTKGGAEAADTHDDKRHKPGSDAADGDAGGGGDAGADGADGANVDGADGAERPRNARELLWDFMHLPRPVRLSTSASANTCWILLHSDSPQATSLNEAVQSLSESGITLGDERLERVGQDEHVLLA